MIDRVRNVPALVIGSGVAGLTAALELGEAVVLTKTSLGEGSSRWAQGGIAAAMAATDDPAAHAHDTIEVSAGLARLAVARLVTSAAPGRISWLESLGAEFDRDDTGRIVLGREAGHSARRIVHADGDATGAELMRTLVHAVRDSEIIEVVEHSLAVDLARDGDRVAGAITIDEDGGSTLWVAGAVVLATGGIGRIYERTTNPVEVTGDGLAMGIRAGVRYADLEFVQFHPTALAASLDPMPLLTEALRGEGAVLLDDDGDRFMPRIHRDAELAPRDVVARACWAIIDRGGRVYLDATSIPRVDERFPTITGFATAAGLRPAHDPLPVSPAEHYHMGGLVVDEWGRSSNPGLWVCGEASNSGLHGANRLASNSLVEGLVYGARVARSIEDAALDPPDMARVIVPDAVPSRPAADLLVEDVRATMWQHVGVTRTAAGLTMAERHLESLAGHVETAEQRTAVVVAQEVTAGALARTESRGSHYRTDHPAPRPALRRSLGQKRKPVAARPLLARVRGAA